MAAGIAMFLSLCALLVPASHAVEEFGYRVTDRKPQDRQNFVQGLEIVDGYLYVSSGNYGRSRLLRYRFDDGTLDTGRPVHPRLFAEGLTVFGDRVYQLTWRARMALVYSREELEGLEWFPLAGEGWGLTNNGEELIYSDGSHHLHFLSPVTRRISRSVAVTRDGAPVPQLNELEWVDGRIWANIWRSDRIVIIDPASGEVTAEVDLSGLLPAAERRPDTGVLNGIARDPADGSIWVTGKRWPWLYQIELVPRGSAQSGRESR
jgi:glutamine cyclotransferase